MQQQENNSVSCSNKNSTDTECNFLPKAILFNGLCKVMVTANIPWHKLSKRPEICKCLLGNVVNTISNKKQLYIK
jgi:hypothetical protein